MPLDRLKRREFITLLGGAAATWPIAARAQPTAMPVIGFLSANRLADNAQNLESVRRGLADAGYVDGKNVSIEYHWSGANDRLPAVAADLAARRVDVIIAGAGTPGALAAKAATSTIPVVFFMGGDPVAAGLVASLNRPSGNLTGMCLIDVAAKRFELLRELLPAARAIAFLINPTNPYGGLETSEVRNAERSLGLALRVVNASNENDIDTAFVTLAREGSDALVVSADTFLWARREQIVALAARNKVPAFYAYRDSVVAGGLMSYGASIADGWRQVGAYTGRILRGEKPADLPVIQPTKFELIINMNTAKALGLDVPASLLARADEVIE